ncbi:hypothetical protein D3C78_1766120 [compost metagenome]
MEITKKYKCETPRPPREEVVSDSTAVDDEMLIDGLEDVQNGGTTQEEGLSTSGDDDASDVLSTHNDAAAIRPRDSLGFGD